MRFWKEDVKKCKNVIFLTGSNTVIKVIHFNNIGFTIKLNLAEHYKIFVSDKKYFSS